MEKSNICHFHICQKFWSQFRPAQDTRINRTKLAIFNRWTQLMHLVPAAALRSCSPIASTWNLVCQNLRHQGMRVVVAAERRPDVQAGPRYIKFWAGDDGLVVQSVVRGQPCYCGHKNE